VGKGGSGHQSTAGTAAGRWWTDIDTIVYRPRTTPESSLNNAFFGDNWFDVESWPLGERIDVLTALVLHESFTVNWDLGDWRRQTRYTGGLNV
jgi:hypothetical protein